MASYCGSRCSKERRARSGSNGRPHPAVRELGAQMFAKRLAQTNCVIIPLALPRQSAGTSLHFTPNQTHRTAAARSLSWRASVA
jgi:hypothetical protein